MRQSLFKTVAGLRSVNLLKKRLLYNCSPVHFAKFLRTPFLQNTTTASFCTFGYYAKGRVLGSWLKERVWISEETSGGYFLFYKN